MFLLFSYPFPAMHAGYVFVNLVPKASPFEIGKGKYRK